jgi:hypothetical protein
MPFLSSVNAPDLQNSQKMMDPYGGCHLPRSLAVALSHLCTMFFEEVWSYFTLRRKVVAGMAVAIIAAPAHSLAPEVAV